MTDQQKINFEAAKAKAQQIFDNSGFKEMILIFRTGEDDIAAYQTGQRPTSVTFNYLMHKIETFLQVDHNIQSQNSKEN